MCFAEAAFQWHHVGAVHTGLGLFCNSCGTAWFGFGDFRRFRQWEGANELSLGGYELPETLQELGFHPRAQGQGWRGKRGEKSSAQLQTHAHLLSPCPEGPDKLVSPWPSFHQPAQDRLKALSELETLIQLQALRSSARWTTGCLIKVRNIIILQKNQFSLIILLFLLVLLVAIDLGSSKQAWSPCTWITRSVLGTSVSVCSAVCGLVYPVQNRHIKNYYCLIV